MNAVMVAIFVVVAIVAILGVITLVVFSFPPLE